jgi:hypothetical protein
MHNAFTSAPLIIDQQYREIVACCDELLNAFALENPVSEVGRIRQRIAKLVQANLALEETEIMGPLRRLPVNQRPRDFADVAEEEAHLRARYSEHVRAWDLVTIAGDLKGYRRDTSGLIRQMKSHLSRKQLLVGVWKRALGRSS